MDCVNCGKRAGYNRLIVDLVSDERVGGYCRNCEFDVFGKTLSRFSSDDDACMLCNRDGLYAIPAWEPSKEQTDRTTTCSVDVDVRERTPLLCDEHYNELCLEAHQSTVAKRRSTR